MKNARLTLFTLLIIIFSCDNNESKNDEKIINVTELTEDVTEALDDNFEGNETELVEDLNESFNQFDFTNPRKTDVTKDYDTITGQWVIIRDIEFNREVVRYRNGNTVTRQDDVDIYVENKTRFNSADGSAIKYPRNNAIIVEEIVINRQSDIKIETTVSVERGNNDVVIYKSKNRDKTSNHSINLKRTENESIWMLEFNVDKVLDIEISKKDTMKTLNATMKVTGTDLSVNKIKILNKHRANIISGTIQRVIEFSNGNSFKVITTFFDCDDPNNVDNKKYVRSYYKNDSEVPFKVITVNCSIVK